MNLFHVLSLLTSLQLSSQAFRPRLPLFATSSRRDHLSEKTLLSHRQAITSSAPNTKTASYPNHERETSPLLTFLENVALFVGSTATMVVALVFFGFLAWRRDAFMVAFVVGSIVNSTLSILLKRLFNQSRPIELEGQSKLKRKPTDKGMPSSHSMAFGFIVAFTSLKVPWTTLPLIVYALVSLYYRILVKLHTWQQIAVGLAMGTMNGYVWHQMCRTTRLLKWVNDSVLNTSGQLPVPLLLVPVAVGALMIGSLKERYMDMTVRGIHRRAQSDRVLSGKQPTGTGSYRICLLFEKDLCHR